MGVLEHEVNNAGQTAGNNSDKDFIPYLRDKILLKVGLPDLVLLVTSPLLSSTPILVDAATTAALPAGAYNNGTSGVGATFTITANGVFPTIDGVVPALGKRYLVKNQSAKLQNGPYSLTVLGTAATSAVLTRTTDSDATAEFDPQVVFVGGGTVNGKRYYTQTTPTPVPGTSSINYVKGSGLGSSSLALPSTEIAYGTGTGVGSSSNFTFNSSLGIFTLLDIGTGNPMIQCIPGASGSINFLAQDVTQATFSSIAFDASSIAASFTMQASAVNNGSIQIYTADQILFDHGIALSVDSKVIASVAADSFRLRATGNLSNNLRFYNTGANGGDHYIEFRNPNTIAANITYILPTTAPTDGQQLTATAPVAGISTLSWT